MQKKSQNNLTVKWILYLKRTSNQIDFLFVVNVGFPVLPLFKTISF